MLSIGAVSRATGIPVETLRTWERRYRFPEAERKPSGHRLYPVSTVPRLRRVLEALERGHRPAQVLPLGEQELGELLTALEPPRRRRAVAPAPLPSPRPEDAGSVRELLTPVLGFDGEALHQRLEVQLAKLGPIRFLEECAGPLYREIGDAWHDGRVDVRHEHFATARIRDFLRSVRRPFEERADGPWVALATLSDDQHEGGLLMVSVIFALAGWRILYLGTDTPLEQIVALARDTDLDAVAVSVSETAGEVPDKALRTLRRGLPRSVALLAGGAGLDGVQVSGMETFESLFAVERWAAERTSGAEPRR